MKKRDLKLEKFGISKWRYRELFNFCLQYQEWKAKLKYEADTCCPKPLFSRSKVNATGNDPTALLVMRRLKWADNCRLVEEAAREAGAEEFKHLLKAVTEAEVTYPYLRLKTGLSWSEKEFLSRRRVFYCLLDKKIS